MQPPTPELIDKTKPMFLTGFGQSDTHALILSDGKPNLRETAGKPYSGISGRDLVAMVKAPQSCVKEAAQWFIPSDYRECDGRSQQRRHGGFSFLALDVDSNNLALSDVLAIVSAVTGDCGLLIYSTSSATAENRKWRALVPLQDPIVGADYGDTARAFNDMLEDQSGGVLIPDRALERTGQLIYLPNKRGDYYEPTSAKARVWP